MNKTSAREIFSRATKKEEVKRSNYTFRLPDALMREYKKLCAKSGVSMGKPIEEFLIELVGSKLD